MANTRLPAYLHGITFGRRAEERPPTEYSRPSAPQRLPTDVPDEDRVAELWCTRHSVQRPKCVAVLTSTHLITFREEARYPHFSHPVDARCPACPRTEPSYMISNRKLRAATRRPGKTLRFIDAADVSTDPVPGL